MTRYKIRNFGPIFKWPTSKGPSGLGLSKKTLTKQMLQYSAEKMRKNLQKRPKMTKFEKNGLYDNGRSSAEYDHVFWLEVDLEPAGPGLDARRFSLTSVNRFAGKCRKTSILRRRKNGFSAFSGEPVGRFSNRFFLVKGLPKGFQKVLHNHVATTHRLAAIPFSVFFGPDFWSPWCKIQNLFKLEGTFFSKNFLV